MARVSSFFGAALLMLLAQGAATAQPPSELPASRPIESSVPGSPTSPTIDPIRIMRLHTVAAEAPHSAAAEGDYSYIGSAPDYTLTGNRTGFHKWFHDCKVRGCSYTDECCHLVSEDYRHYYSCPNLCMIAVALGAAAPLANTKVDENFRDWYQRDVRTQTSDDLSAAAKVFGEWKYAVPAFLAADIVGKCCEDWPAGAVVHDWGNRSLRALIVGAPPVGVLQVVLGASRPTEAGSKWRPLHDSNGVSGHAFVGSVPFLTAAAMTDNPFCRYPLIAASFLTGWSRINDNAHYLSQVVLGWSMGCAAVLSVNDTEWERKRVQVMPVTPSGDPGVGVKIQY